MILILRLVSKYRAVGAALLTSLAAVVVVCDVHDCELSELQMQMWEGLGNLPKGNLPKGNLPKTQALWLGKVSQNWICARRGSIFLWGKQEKNRPLLKSWIWTRSMSPSQDKFQLVSGDYRRGRGYVRSRFPQKKPKQNYFFVTKRGCCIPKF